jgi:hypothetical protein
MGLRKKFRDIIIGDGDIHADSSRLLDVSTVEYDTARAKRKVQTEQASTSSSVVLGSNVPTAGGRLILVTGKGEGNEFTDLLLLANSSITKVSESEQGTPSSRSYSWDPGPNELSLSMGSGTYNIISTEFAVHHP